MDGSVFTPFGAWKSPITSTLIVSESIGLSEPHFDGDTVCWLESRPQEGGRSVIVRHQPGGSTEDRLPAPFNARTRVHEYGGGSYLASGGHVYFSHYDDQRLYQLGPDGTPEALTPAGAWRYADAVADPQRNRLICVREDHTDSAFEAINTLVAVSLKTGEATELVSGHDFYASPRLSPDGRQLAWLAWEHPNMPWDGCELWVGDLTETGHIVNARIIAGGPEESILQPAWSAEGILHFVSDSSGWWNLYRWRDYCVEPLCPMEAEFGRPPWQFGYSQYAFLDGHIACVMLQNGIATLVLLDPVSGELDPLELPFTDYSYLQAANNKLLFLAASPTRTRSLYQLDLSKHCLVELRRGNYLDIDPGYFSRPQTIAYPTERGQTAHGFYYPPTNPDYAASPTEKPPLLVISHGGPTSATSAILSLKVQYWTSRGFAVVDVNYGGSSGYGRDYRDRLKGRWGIVDQEDCTNAARFLVDQGLVDPERLAITGGSAGGYTTLCCLTFQSLFKAGASHFGVSDIELLALETHKFESRYLDGLIGPYPDFIERYHERSPIYHTDRINCAVLLLQGLEDQVVPPNQSELMYEAARDKGLPAAYLPFAGEQHGFRQARNIKRALEAELYFYSRIFGFTLAEAVTPLVIDNLDTGPVQTDQVPEALS